MGLGGGRRAGLGWGPGGGAGDRRNKSREAEEGARAKRAQAGDDGKTWAGLCALVVLVCVFCPCVTLCPCALPPS